MPLSVPTFVRIAIKLFRGQVSSMLEEDFSTLRKCFWITCVLVIFIILMISEYKLSVRSDQSKQRFVVMNSQLIYVLFFFNLLLSWLKPRISTPYFITFKTFIFSHLPYWSKKSPPFQVTKNKWDNLHKRPASSAFKVPFHFPHKDAGYMVNM